MKPTQSRFGLCLALVAGLIVSLPSLHVQAREWTAKDGRKLQATFVSIQGDKIELKLANGQTAAVPRG